ncbi:hypothetical protein E4U41_006799 [Claviceps citrina]|nr:hypothetical protein E4U41_006799 [Claviceps citrina]
MPGQPPHAIDRFMHQPNPDYTTTSATSAVAAPPRPPDRDAPSAAPRRRSYHRLLAVGMDFPPPPPPPPPDAADLFLLGRDGEPHHHRAMVGVEGEIVSAVGDDGAGWTRHTRVYGGGGGGGVCLACAAAGSRHGGGVTCNLQGVPG